MTQPAPSEHRQRLTATFERIHELPLAVEVLAAHEAAIAAVKEAAERLCELGELKWSAAFETKVTDLEVQARRHLEAIENRKPVNDNGGSDVG